MSKTRQDLEAILNADDSKEEASMTPSIKQRVPTGAVIAGTVLGGTTLVVVLLLLNGTLQSWAASWLVSGRAPYALRGPLEKLAKMGSIRHRRSSKFRLLQDSVVINPISLIDGMFLYGCLEIDGDLRELYDFDVNSEEISIEFGKGVGKYLLHRYENGSWIFVNKDDPSDSLSCKVPSELEVREMRFLSGVK